MNNDNKDRFGPFGHLWSFLEQRKGRAGRGNGGSNGTRGYAGNTPSVGHGNWFGTEVKSSWFVYGGTAIMCPTTAYLAYTESAYVVLLGTLLGIAAAVIGISSVILPQGQSAFVAVKLVAVAAILSFSHIDMIPNGLPFDPVSPQISAKSNDKSLDFKNRQTPEIFKSVVE